MTIKQLREYLCSLPADKDDLPVEIERKADHAYEYESTETWDEDLEVSDLSLESRRLFISC